MSEKERTLNPKELELIYKKIASRVAVNRGNRLPLSNGMQSEIKDIAKVLGYLDIQMIESVLSSQRKKSLHHIHLASVPVIPDSQDCAVLPQITNFQPFYLVICENMADLVTLRRQAGVSPDYKANYEDLYRTGLLVET